MITITPDDARNVTLDRDVSTHHSYSGGTFDYIGNTPETSSFIRTRISEVYRSQKGLIGYLELSRVGLLDDKNMPGMLGIIEVPSSIIHRLTGLGGKLVDRFSHDFKVKLDKPDNTNISPFLNVELPEDEYYWCCHPNAHNIPESVREFKRKYKEDLLILTGYMSRMDQWLNHAFLDKMGREKIEYDGTARLVGPKRHITTANRTIVSRIRID